MSDDAIAEARSWFEDPPGRAGAERLFDAFVAGQGRRHRWFVDRARAAGLATGWTADDLAGLVRWVAAHWDADDPAIERPVWYGSADRQGGMGTLGAALVDGLIAHVAVFVERLGGRWELRRDDRPHDADAHRPVMTVGTVPPWRLAQGAVARHRVLGEDPTRLGQLLADLAARIERPGPALPEPTFGVSVIDTSGGSATVGPGWDMSGAISEELPALLGPVRLEELERALAAVAGVRRFQWDDQESFQLDTDRSRTAAEIERAMQAVVDRALDAG